MSYGWDENKNKTSETIGGTMSDYGFSVGSSGYDDEDRIVTRGIGILPVIPNRTHDPTHEMLTVTNQRFTHDSKGNTTLNPSSLRPTSSSPPWEWDFKNKLIAVETDIFHKFDALGRRVGSDDGTANVISFQDGQQTIADYPSGTAASSPTYTYVYASNIDEPVMRGGSGGLRYYHRNQQYSITAVTDGGGAVIERYAYSAYGQVTIADASGSSISSSAIANRYTVTGREWDEGLSLYHYRDRMYDAVGGRFVSRDPIGNIGSKWNLYEYVGSRALSYVDPTGLYGPMPGWKPIEPREPTNVDPEPIELPEADWPRMVCNYYSSSPRPVIIKPGSPLHNKIFNSPSFQKCRADAKMEAGQIASGMGSGLGCWES